MNKRKSADVVRFTVSAAVAAGVPVVGAMLPLPVGTIACGRAFSAVVVLLIVALTLRINPFPFRLRHMPLMVISGACVGGAWMLYFAALKITSIAAVEGVVFSFALWGVVIGGFAGRGMHVSYIIFGIFAVLGLLLMVPKYDVAYAGNLGFAYAIGATLLIAVGNLAFTKLMYKYDMGRVMYAAVIQQFFFAGVACLPTFFFGVPVLPLEAAGWLMVLGAVMTAGARLLQSMVIMHISPGVMTLFYALQPIFAVVLAWVFLRQTPAPRVLAGMVLVILCTLAVTNIHRIGPQKIFRPIRWQ